MRDWLEVLILAVIEGVTEFLPISSTGHMLLAKEWLAYKPDELFLAVVQSGAVLSVLLVFTERVRQILREWHLAETKQFVFKLAAAFFCDRGRRPGPQKTRFRVARESHPSGAGHVDWRNSDFVD